jgi:hypothetical protein
MTVIQIISVGTAGTIFLVIIAVVINLKKDVNPMFLVFIAPTISDNTAVTTLLVIAV